MSRSVVVTGGNRGIGLAVARAFAENGDKVAVTHRTGEPPAGLFGVRCDVRDGAGLERAFEEIRAQQGPVEVLVANAGTTRDGLLIQMPEQDFADVIDTNLLGTMRAVKIAALDMIGTRKGRLILMGSTAGFRGAQGAANYTASKSAMVGLARSLAWELGRRKITVNVVLPGLIDTDMVAEMPDAYRKIVLGETPLRRSGSAEEVAGVVRFLASDEASFITGALIPVSGGAAMGH